MANIVQLKRSSVVGKVPDAGNIEVGEPAVNLVDKILYTKDTGGNVIVIGSGTTSNVIEGSNLYFTNARVVTAISSQTLSNATFSGELVTTSIIKSLNSSGDEGGEVQLAIPVTNTSLNGPIAIDVYQNKLRIFETTGTNRGVYIDLSAANSGVGTNLISAGGGGGAVNSVNGQTGTVVLSTANIAENGNLYYTDARVYSNVISIGYANNANVTLKANITDLTTANVTEVTNLYFTNARSRQALTAGTGVTYDNSTGTISIGQNVDTLSSVTFSNVSANSQFIKINNLGSVSGATTINLTLGNMITATATGAVQWTVTGLQGTSNYGSIFLLELTNGGVGTQTWMSGIKWPSGTAPTLQASGVDVLAFFTDDNGTTWRGVLNMSNSS